jgi:hypothetical protein
MNHLDNTILNLYLDDALDAQTRAGVEAHAAECETCRRELEAMRALSASVEAWRTEPIPQDLSVPVLSRLAKRPAPALVSRWGAALLAVQAVSGALILIWLLPTLVRMLGGLVGILPAFDWGVVDPLRNVTSSFAVSFPSLALWVWIVALGAGAIVWLVGNRLMLYSLDKSFNHTSEVSQ